MFIVLQSKDDDVTEINKDSHYYLKYGNTDIFDVADDGQIKTKKPIFVTDVANLTQLIGVCVNNIKEYTTSNRSDECRNITVSVKVCHRFSSS